MNETACIYYSCIVLQIWLRATVMTSARHAVMGYVSNVVVPSADVSTSNLLLG